MAKIATNIRLSEAHMSNLKHAADADGVKLTEYVTNALNNQTRGEKREFLIGNIPFYPVHVSSEEIRKVIQLVNSSYNDQRQGNRLRVQVRKSSGGKGLEFLFYFDHVEQASTVEAVRQWSFVLAPNWYIIDFFDHWVSENRYGKSDWMCRRRQSPVKDTEIQKLIHRRISQGGPPLSNPHFAGDKWVQVFREESECFVTKHP